MRHLIKSILRSLGLERLGRAIYARFSRRFIWIGHHIQIFLVRKRTLAASSRDLSLIVNLLRPEKVGASLMRIGSDGDGGYIVPDDLVGIVSCFSPGVGDNSDFEKDLASRGIKCYLTDGTVENPPLSDPLFHFSKKNLSVFPINSKEIKFDNWINDNLDSLSEELILQMDIEGSEWGIILNTSDSLLQNFRIMTIEFHDLQLISTRLGFDLISNVLSKIHKNFAVVHIHPNNWRLPIRVHGIDVPPILEVTYLRRDRANFGVPNDFTNAKNFRNMPALPEINLSSLWH